MQSIPLKKGDKRRLWSLNSTSGPGKYVHLTDENVTEGKIFYNLWNELKVSQESIKPPSLERIRAEGIYWHLELLTAVLSNIN